MTLGLIDYLTDKIEELHDELMERGARKGEDIKEFFEDVLENIPMMAKNSGNGSGVEHDAEEDVPARSGGLNIAGSIRDFVDGLGLASGNDLKEIVDRLERIEKNVKTRSGVKS